MDRGPDRFRDRLRAGFTERLGRRLGPQHRAVEVGPREGGRLVDLLLSS